MTGGSFFGAYFVGDDGLEEKMAEGERLRSVLVTGSGSGIGAAIARRLAKPGTGILVHALHNRAGCEAVAAELRQAGATAEVMLGDLSRPETGGLLVEQACRSFGGLDVLIANAGFPDRRPFGTLDRAGLDYCIGVVTGGFFELVDLERRGALGPMLAGQLAPAAGALDQDER